MTHCPNCKYENDEGTEFCRECGIKLTTDPDNSIEESFDSAVYLTYADDEIQASVFTSKLSAYDIPIIKKYRQSGSYMSIYTGNTIFGIDLYVPAGLYTEAKKILDDNPASDDELEFDSMLDDYGFDDIDNLYFDQNESAKPSQLPSDYWESDTKKNKQNNIPEADSKFFNFSWYLLKNRKLMRKTYAVIIIAMVIITILIQIFSGLTKF